MKCNVCGRQIQNEEANFCEYCGSSFRERVQNSIHMNPNGQGNLIGQGIPYGNTPIPNGRAPQPGMQMQEEPVPFSNWLGSYGLRLIPFVGWLVFLIMLFVWAFSSSTPESKRNWARAKLIYVVISTIFFLILLFLVIIPVYIPMYQDAYQHMQNGTYDPTAFNKEWMQKFTK